MATIETIDVTVIEPKLKHPTIFKKFDEIPPGEAFVIHNDHDPRPLYYQLLGERGDIFTWEYLTEGPEVWEVRIRRKTGKSDPTVGEVVAKDYRKAEIFKKYGIDFCCGGKKTLAESCAESGADVLQVEKELKAVEQQPAIPSQNYDTWELDFLCDYIVNTHHKYVKENIPVIYEYSQKVAKVHGDAHPEVIEVARIFSEIASELSMHMRKEEGILFPYIKQMVAGARDGKFEGEGCFASVEGPINVMQMEHERAGAGLDKIKELSNNYTPPADACASYNLVYAKLKEFEEDLHIHVHLENNILFPKAIALEKTLC